MKRGKFMNEDKKDFNAMMNNQKNMPKITKIEDEVGQKRWGGSTLVVAPATDYDELMKRVPKGKLVTTNELRKAIAKKYNVEVCCPLTAGIFINISAWASSQRKTDLTPYWRTVKTNGELNAKYPGGVEAQKQKLEQEGFSIIEKGKKNKKLFVKDFEKFIFNF